MKLKPASSACGICILLWGVLILVLVASMLLPLLQPSSSRIVLGPLVIEGTVITESKEDLALEEFKCEFNTPLKHITIIGHYYTNYPLLNEEYWELNPDDDKEVWGWSDCIWQPENDWAACDMYLKIPDTVVDVDDYAIETGGHEYWHAACGDFHD